MYNFFADMKTNIQPMIDVALINHKAWERLTLLQSDCFTDCVSAGLKQCKALAESQGTQAATELQMQYFRDLESKLNDAAEQEFAALNEARDALTEVMERNYIRISNWELFREANAGIKDAGPKA